LKNIAVIGCGRWGQNLVRNFATIGALGAACDTDKELLAKTLDRHIGVAGHTDYQKLLSEEFIDGVVVATPSDTHYRIAKDALMAGKDVFVEKPLALSVEEGAELVKIATDNERILLVGHLLEYHPAVVKLKDMVDDGLLGRINYISSTRLDFGSVQKGSDVIWTYAPHDIDTILLLVGHMPVSVSTRGGDYIQDGIVDVAFTTLDFAGGLKALLYLSWLYPHKERKLVVIGDRGMVVFDDVGSDKLSLYRQAVEWKSGTPILNPVKGEVVEADMVEPLRLECEDFVKCIETRQQPRVAVSRALQALELLVACQKSMDDNGKAVSIPMKMADYYTHESAVIDEDAQIGKGTCVWHFSHISEGAIIGENCVIGQNCYVGPNVKIGNGVKIQNNVSVYTGVILEDDVFCGPSCVFTNDKYPKAYQSNKDKWLPTLVRKGASIGGNATIMCGVTIGRYALIGAGAVVTKDVLDRQTVIGNPARKVR